MKIEHVQTPVTSVPVPVPAKLSSKIAEHDAEKEKRFNIVAESQKIGMSTEQTLEFYKEWVKTYEDDLIKVGYQAPQLAADYLAKQKVPKNDRILDVAAGTGWCALLLRDEHGYKNFDALDACPDMLAVAKTRNIYDNIHCQLIGEGRTIDIPTNSYDHITLAGGLVSGHIKLDAFDELIRIVKPGGLIVISMREENRTKVPEYLDIDQVFASYVQRGLWQQVEEVITKNYYMGLDGLVYVYKITKPQ